MKMTDCKQCDKVVINWLGDIGCPIIRDWLTHTEYKTKKVLDNCPMNRGKYENCKSFYN